MCRPMTNNYLVVAEENHIGSLLYHAFCRKGEYGLAASQRLDLERINFEVVAERPLTREAAERMEGLLGKLQQYLHENDAVQVTKRVDQFLEKNSIVTTI